MPATDGIFTDSQAHDILDRAYAVDPGGIKIRCSTREAAIALRHRLNYFRKKDRAESTKTYSPGHPMHGHSAYDKLELIISRDDETIVHIRHRGTIEIIEVTEVTK